MESPSLKTRCPQCDTSVKVDYDLVGERVLCPGCRTRFVVMSVEFQTPETSLAVSALDTGHDPSASNTDAPEKGQPARPAAQPSPGSRFGRFEIHETLGSGAFGVVYRAHDPLLDRDVALKLPRFAGSEQKKVQRFLAEAKAAGKLRHPHIVAVYESGELQGTLFITSEYVEGRTLAEAIKANPPTQEQAVRWVCDLARALSYAHSQGIVHRDIKPHNVMLDRQQRPQIMDFGLAKRLDQDSRMTIEGALLGTPAYMAPEQARGEAGRVGPASDQYSLGTVLYELLSGRRPFEGSRDVVVALVATTEPPSLRSINPEIPPDLEAICKKAMNKDPDQRYSDVSLLAADLERCLAGEPVLVRPLSRTRQLTRWAGRRPALAALTGAVALLLLMAMAGGITASTMMLVSKNELQARLDDVQRQTQRTRDLAQAAKEAAEAARVQTAAADRELQQAHDATEKLEQAVADRDRVVEQKTQEEDRLNDLIEQRKQSEQGARRAADDKSKTETAAGAVQKTATAARQQLYIDLLRQAQRALNEGNRKAAAELLDKCPPEERHWEWRFLHGKAAGDEKVIRHWVVYSKFKEVRNPVMGTSQLVAANPGTAPNKREENLNQVTKPMGGMNPATPVYWTSDDGRTMPTEADDPRWVNVPPVLAKSVEVSGQIETFAPMGNAVLTSSSDSRNRISLAVTGMDADRTPSLLGSTLAPMRRVASSMQRKERLAMGFAFTRDGSTIAQFSTVPADVKKSAIRTLSVGGGKSTWSQPDEEMAKGLAGVAHASPGKLVGLARYYNEHTANDAAHLVLESDMAVCPDGNRVAIIDKDQMIRILDRDASQEIFAMPSGIDVAAILAAADVKREAFDPRYAIGGTRVLWSLDGKRLLARFRYSVTYAWGQGTFVNIRPPTGSLQIGENFATDVRQESLTSSVEVLGTSVLRIPPIHFDCVIVMSAE